MKTIFYLLLNSLPTIDRIRQQIFIYLIFLVFSSINIYSQELSDQKIFEAYYQETIELISQKKFQEANEKFKKISKLELAFPDELAYYYGYTQYNLGQYMIAKEAFEKYIKLKTDTGRYVGVAEQFIHTADCNLKGYYFNNATCEACEGLGLVDIECRTCKGKGQELCNQCFGRGAIKKRDNFGETFESCKKCIGTGYFTCTKCHDSKHEKGKCLVCDGKGKLKIKKDCNQLPNK
ncbi:MAG: hypothetical protein EAZ07_04215 [Cytophagales bacterium]|nr:MAG: hypothetical protein EAZ07_04215 [Cytophagales bacterium]